MSDVRSPVGTVVGTVLAGVLVVAALILLGLDPVLGVLAGAVVGIDLWFYRNRGCGSPSSGRQDPSA